MKMERDVFIHKSGFFMYSQRPPSLHVALVFLKLPMLLVNVSEIWFDN